MAEPRRPRIITSRPGPAPESNQDGPGNSYAPGTATARPVSEKVSVAPVPAEDTAAAKPAWAPKLPKTTKEPRAVKEPKAPKEPRAAKPAKAPKPVKAPKAAKVTKASGVQHPASATVGANVLAFPEPAHKRRRRHVWLGVAGVAVVLAIVMVVALYSPVLAVKTITFKGNKLVAEKTLQTALEPLLSKPLPQVTQGDVTDLLAKVPQIKSSRLVAEPPSTLAIQVVERIPVALLKNGNDYLLVDQDGVQLGSTRNPAAVPLPQIDGGKAAIGRSTFSAMTAVLATLPQSVLGKLANATAKSPDAVQLQLTDGKTVIWGNASDMELKAQVLDALINAPAPVPVDGTPPPPPVRVYDVSAPRHPVTR